jgi:hypothetical protein
MLSWSEIADEIGDYFVAVKRADRLLEVQTDSLPCWIGLEEVDVVGVASVMLVARIAEPGASDEPQTVRVMLPVERLDWPSLKAACEEAARVALALACPKDCS